jgi:hypothetical protein
MDFLRRAKTITIGVCAAMVVALGAGAVNGPVHAASVDDWTQLASEVAGGGDYDEFGDKVALSADGTIMAVGAIAAGGGAGQVRAYGYVSGAWTQLGDPIDGTATKDKLGSSVALSADGTIMAVGASQSGQIKPGLVRVFQFGSGAWTQLGADITGLADKDQFGASLALSADGMTLAVGAPNKDGSSATRVGQVRAFKLVGSSWTQVGLDINGAATDDFLGTSVALSSDGTVMAVGVPSSGVNVNRVKVFKLVGSSWTQVGTDITATAGGHFGWSLALSTDGTIVAVGADGVNAYAGQVQVFQLVSGSWAQLGANIDGATGDAFGYSIAMSANGTTLAIGAIGVNAYAGQVQVFELVDSLWTQVGTDLTGTAAIDYAGWSVALSADGETVAMGIPYATSVPYTSNGVVRVYAWPTPAPAPAPAPTPTPTPDSNSSGETTPAVTPVVAQTTADDVGTDAMDRADSSEVPVVVGVPNNPVTPKVVTPGVVLVGEKVAAATPTRKMNKAPGPRIGRAPKVPATVGTPVSLAASGLTSGVVYSVQIKTSDGYVSVGATVADADGLAQLPVMTLTRKGTHTFTITDPTTGEASYIKVKVAPRG